MKRPLLFIFIFLVLGIIGAYFIKGLFIIFLFLILFLLSLYFSKRYKISFPRYLILFSLLGYYLIYANNYTYCLNEKEKIKAVG